MLWEYLVVACCSIDIPGWVSVRGNLVLAGRALVHAISDSLTALRDTNGVGVVWDGAHLDGLGNEPISRMSKIWFGIELTDDAYDEWVRSGSNVSDGSFEAVRSAMYKHPFNLGVLMRLATLYFSNRVSGRPQPGTLLKAPLPLRGVREVKTHAAARRHGVGSQVARRCAACEE